MKKIKEIFNLICVNLKPLIAFELIYKATCGVLFVPLIWRIFDLIMYVSGYTYLTLENIISFAANPLTILTIVLLLMLAAVCAMIDISAVVFTLDQSRQKNPVHLWQIIRFAVKNALRVCLPKNILLIVVVLIFIPFLNVGMASGFLSAISIPEFILDYIRANHVLSTLFLAVILILYALMAKWLYAFHYFTLEGCSFREARKRSSSLGKRKRLKDFISLFLVQVVFALLMLLVILLLVALTFLCGSLFSEIFVARWISSTVVWMVIDLVLAVTAALSLPVSYGCLSVLYYRHKAEKKESVCHSSAPQYSSNPRIVRMIHYVNVAFGCVMIAGSLVLGYFLCSGKLNPRVEYLRTMEITAHRGASVLYPENTMAAFKGAYELGADWIELDVQQSKDGEIIVIHDTNFKRTTGVDANTWDLTYAEISDLDAGSFFSPDYAGEKIPLLSEVAVFAKENGIKLNIELKPTGHETDFEKSVVDIIRETGIEDICVITSQVYEVLENVKAYDASISTVYVMSIAYGDITQLKAADHFSVEASNATESLIARVHRAGKELFVWTVNTKDSITKMAERNVDNIITDNIELAKQCVYESRYSNLLIEYLELFQ